MASESYLALLRDPRWQRKRLEIMQRDDFACCVCGDGATTLNVHHKKYRRGAKPWEYEASELITLCERCHKGVSEATATMAEIVGSHPAPDDLVRLVTAYLELPPKRSIDEIIEFMGGRSA